MNSFVEVHETCILFFSGMNKFQIRGGKFHGLPFAAMRVMEDKTCIQANEWEGVVENGNILISRDEWKIVSFHLICFADAGNVSVVEETVDRWAGDGPAFFTIDGNDTFQIVYRFETSVQMLLKLQVVVDLIIDIKLIIA